MTTTIHMRRTLKAACAASALIASIFTPAMAAGPTPAPMTEWNKVCAPGGGGEVCIVRRDVASADGKLAASLSIQVPPTDGKAHMAALVPTMTLVARGLMLQVDGGSPMTVPFRYCRGAYCHAEVSVGAAMIEALKGGGTLTLTRRDAENQPISAEISLIGFTAAAESEASAPASNGDGQ